MVGRDHLKGYATLTLWRGNNARIEHYSKWNRDKTGNSNGETVQTVAEVVER
jgi:hypothetical protein